MKEMNILLLLTPKNELALLDDSMSIRQALEKMKFHGFSAVPVISKETGEYLGSISEGNLLWHIVDKDEYNISKLAKQNIKSIINPDKYKPVNVFAKEDELVKMITAQNFVPIVDDRNVLMGIVTRKKVMDVLTNKG